MSNDNTHRSDIRSVTALWARAESQLYPLVMSDPDAFERALTIVRAIADRLRGEKTAEELARAFTESGALAMAAAHDSGTPIDDLNADVLTAAGFRLRQQEIAAGAGQPGRGEPSVEASEEEREEQIQ